MRSSTPVMSLLVFILLVAANSLFAAPPVVVNRLRHDPAVRIYQENLRGEASFVSGQLAQSISRGSEEQASLAFFEANKDAFGLKEPSTELSLRRLDVDRLGHRHLRFDQLYNGVRVYGAQMLSHISTDDILTTVNGHYESDLSISVLPSIPASEAMQVAIGDLTVGRNKRSEGRAELVIFPWEEAKYLVWNLTLLTDAPQGRWEYFIDAHSGKIILKANRIMTAEAVGTGTSVMGTPRNHIDSWFTGSSYQMIDRTRRAGNDLHGHGGLMAAGADIETRVAGASLPGSIAVDADNVWSDAAQQSSVDGHVYTALVYDWWLREFGRNSYTDAGSSMLVTVDYSGQGSNNAFWNGSRVVFWSWSGSWRSLAGAPDVVAHEWGHAITQFTSGLIYQQESGALNESFSDMMGAAFEWAHDSLDPGDWFMGENGQVQGTGFRSMSDPHSKGDPDTYGPVDQNWVPVIGCTPTSGNDWCGVHTNSGVGNKWFYLLSSGDIHNGVSVNGIGVENAALVAYQSNAFYWGLWTNYHEAALGTIAAAVDLDTSWSWAGETALAWDAVGVSTVDPDLNFTADTTIGWAPLTINFTAASGLSVNSWTWDLGDGDSAFVQSPQHTYSDGGPNNVSLAITAGSENRFYRRNDYVLVLADTILATNVGADPGQKVAVAVSAVNNFDLTELIIPFELSGDLIVTFDSFSTVGCRTDYFEVQQYIHFDAGNRRYTVRLRPSTDGSQPDLPAGTGPVLKIHLTIPSNATPEQTANLLLAGYLNYEPMFFSSLVSFTPESKSGMVGGGGCCVGIRGDVNGDGSDADIVDLVALVDNLFGPGSPFPCPAEVDMNNDSSIGDIIDVTYLVDFLFGGGPPPADCL